MAKEKEEKKEEKGTEAPEEEKAIGETPKEEEKSEEKKEAKETPGAKEEEKPEEVVKEPKAGAPEEKPEEKAEKKEKPSPKAPPTGKFKDLIEKIEKLTVAELSQFVKELEERLGVSPAVGVVPTLQAAGAPAEGAAPAGVPPEKALYTLMLESAGDQKIQVIKAVREINQELGLKEAKDLVEAAPKEVKKDLKKEEAEEALKKLQAAGAKASLK